MIWQRERFFLDCLEGFLQVKCRQSQVVGAARSNLSQKKFNDLVENSIKSFAEINFRDDDLKIF